MHLAAAVPSLRKSRLMKSRRGIRLSSRPVSADKLHVNREVSEIVDEVVARLEDATGIVVEIDWEITAHTDAGFDMTIQRTVNENCRTLGVDDYGFTC